MHLRLVPYRLKYLTGQSYHKILLRYYGPYEVVEKLGPVAYKLKLPDDRKIHLVFHISRLKKHWGAVVTPHTRLPKVTDDGCSFRMPLKILGIKLVQYGNNRGVEIVVQWKAIQKRKQHGRIMLILESYFLTLWHNKMLSHDNNTCTSKAVELDSLI